MAPPRSTGRSTACSTSGLTTEFLPAGPVAPGDKWSTSFVESKALFGALRQRLRFTLRDISPVEGHPVATISVEGDCELTPPDPAHPDNASRDLTITSSRW